MKKLLVALLSTAFSVLFTNAQTIDKPYDYPIKRGSSEWNSIKNYQNLRNVCQIPLDVVSQMTTEALLESVLNYPLLGDAFVFTTFQKGIDNLKINFNAFEVLSNRPDLGDVLTRKYKTVASKNIISVALIAKGEHSVKLSFLELLSGQGYTKNTLTEAESITLIKVLSDTYLEKKKNGDIYGTMSLSTNVWALNKLLIYNNANEKFVIKNRFIEEGNIFPQPILNEIVDNAKKYLENVSK